MVLRYVNRIELPNADVELEDYFRILPQVPIPIPQIFPTFLFNVEVPYQSLQSNLRIIFGTVIPDGEAKLAYLLDLSMVSLRASPFSTEEVPVWLEAAHKHIEDAFDAAFTEKTHCAIFQEVGQ